MSMTPLISHDKLGRKIITRYNNTPVQTLSALFFSHRSDLTPENSDSVIFYEFSLLEEHTYLSLEDLQTFIDNYCKEFPVCFVGLNKGQPLHMIFKKKDDFWCVGGEDVTNSHKITDDSVVKKAFERSKKGNTPKDLFFIYVNKKGTPYPVPCVQRLEVYAKLQSFSNWYKTGTSNKGSFEYVWSDIETKWDTTIKSFMSALKNDDDSNIDEENDDEFKYIIKANLEESPERLMSLKQQLVNNFYPEKFNDEKLVEYVLLFLRDVILKRFQEQKRFAQTVRDTLKTRTNESEFKRDFLSGLMEKVKEPPKSELSNFIFNNQWDRLAQELAQQIDQNEVPPYIMDYLKELPKGPPVARNVVLENFYNFYLKDFIAAWGEFVFTGVTPPVTIDPFFEKRLFSEWETLSKTADVCKESAPEWPWEWLLSGRFPPSEPADTHVLKVPPRLERSSPDQPLIFNGRVEGASSTATLKWNFTWKSSIPVVLLAVIEEFVGPSCLLPRWVPSRIRRIRIIDCVSYEEFVRLYPDSRGHPLEGLGWDSSLFYYKTKTLHSIDMKKLDPPVEKEHATASEEDIKKLSFYHAPPEEEALWKNRLQSYEWKVVSCHLSSMRTAPQEKNSPHKGTEVSLELPQRWRAGTLKCTVGEGVTQKSFEVVVDTQDTCTVCYESFLHGRNPRQGCTFHLPDALALRRLHWEKTQRLLPTDLTLDDVVKKLGPSSDKNFISIHQLIEDGKWTDWSVLENYLDKKSNYERCEFFGKDALFAGLKKGGFEAASMALKEFLQDYFKDFTIANLVVNAVNQSVSSFYKDTTHSSVTDNWDGLTKWMIYMNDPDNYDAELIKKIFEEEEDEEEEDEEEEEKRIMGVKRFLQEYYTVHGHTKFLNDFKQFVLSIIEEWIKDHRWDLCADFIMKVPPLLSDRETEAYNLFIYFLRKYDKEQDAPTKALEDVIEYYEKKCIDIFIQQCTVLDPIDVLYEEEAWSSLSRWLSDSMEEEGPESQAYRIFLKALPMGPEQARLHYQKWLQTSPPRGQCLQCYHCLPPLSDLAGDHREVMVAGFNPRVPPGEPYCAIVSRQRPYQVARGCSRGFHQGLTKRSSTGLYRWGQSLEDGAKGSTGKELLYRTLWEDLPWDQVTPLKKESGVTGKEEFVDAQGPQEGTEVLQAKANDTGPNEPQGVGVEYTESQDITVTVDNNNELSDIDGENDLLEKFEIVVNKINDERNKSHNDTNYIPQFVNFYKEGFELIGSLEKIVSSFKDSDKEHFNALKREFARNYDIDIDDTKKEILDILKNHKKRISFKEGTIKIDDGFMSSLSTVLYTKKTDVDNAFNLKSFVTATENYLLFLKKVQENSTNDNFIEAYNKLIDSYDTLEDESPLIVYYNYIIDNFVDNVIKYRQEAVEKLTDLYTKMKGKVDDFQKSAQKDVLKNTIYSTNIMDALIAINNEIVSGSYKDIYKEEDVSLVDNFTALHENYKSLYNFYYAWYRNIESMKPLKDKLIIFKERIENNLKDENKYETALKKEDDYLELLLKEANTSIDFNPIDVNGSEILINENDAILRQREVKSIRNSLIQTRDALEEFYNQMKKLISSREVWKKAIDYLKKKELKKSIQASESYLQNVFYDKNVLEGHMKTLTNYCEEYESNKKLFNLGDGVEDNLLKIQLEIVKKKYDVGELLKEIDTNVAQAKDIISTISSLCKNIDQSSKFWTDILSSGPSPVVELFLDSNKVYPRI